MAVSSLAPGCGVSLEEAIRGKYCGGCEEEVSATEEATLPAKRLVKEAAVYLRPGAHPVERLTNIVVERHGVTHVASERELADLCPQVKALHLANNCLSHWQDVSSVLTAFLQLAFLDLSHNNFLSLSILSPSPSPSSSLHVLVLNYTSIPWSAVQTCLKACPCLQELHLNNNGYTKVTLDPSYSHTSLRRLHINNNSISKWVELERLSLTFPTLHTLVAISNPLRDVPEVGMAFPSVHSLTLSSTQLADWSSIESLASLPDLRDLRMCSVPLGQEMSERDRRFSVIARMPALRWLNKSEISATERENAERWFIRRYQDQAKRPRIFQTLVDTHGLLQPLVDLSLSPAHKVTLQFYIDHEDWKRTEVEKVDVRQTTGRLKQTWSRRLNVTVSKLRLFYVDMEVDCNSELTGTTRQLQTYKMKDGDRIHVQLYLCSEIVIHHPTVFCLVCCV